MRSNSQVRTISSSASAPSNFKGSVSPDMERAWRNLSQGKLRELVAEPRITVPQETISESTLKECSALKILLLRLSNQAFR